MKNDRNYTSHLSGVRNAWADKRRVKTVNAPQKKGDAKSAARAM
jgi:hypothetical protein